MIKLVNIIPKTPRSDEMKALTLAAVVSAESWIALAMSHKTLAFAAASVGAVVGHIVGYFCFQRDFLRVSVVVVQR